MNKKPEVPPKKRDPRTESAVMEPPSGTYLIEEFQKELPAVQEEFPVEFTKDVRPTE